MWLLALTFVLCITSTSGARCTRGGPEPPDVSQPEHRRTALVDCHPDLDTTCRTGTLKVQLEVKQFVGPTGADGYLTPETLAELPASLSLTIPGFDVDFEVRNLASGRPERDTVTFNGFALGFLYGENNLWFENSFSMPMNKIKFARWVNGTIVPGVNEVEIAINVENAPGVGTDWCASIDWVALYNIPEYVRPIILVPDLGRHPWDEGWIPEIENLHVPWMQVSFGGTELTIQQRSNALVTAISEWYTILGASTGDIVAFGKGGIDARAYIEDHSEYVTNLVTLASPHGGNRYGDIIERSGISDNGQITWEYAKEMSSSRMEGFNEVYREPRGVTVYTVGAAKDDWVTASSATSLEYSERFVIDEQHQGPLGKHTADIFLSILLPKSVTGRDKYVITPPPALPKDTRVFFDERLGGVAGGQQEEVTVTIDAIGTTDFSIVAFSAEPDLTFTLHGPAGQNLPFPAGSVIGGQFIYTTIGMESSPGEWKITAVNGNTASPEVIPFAVSISGEDAVPLELVVTPLHGALGTVFSVTATAPVATTVSNLLVTFASITNNTETTITMTSTSQTVFTGEFTPSACYQNSVHATLSGPSPRIADTTISMGCQVLPAFTIADEGQDANGDTFFDNLRVTMTYPQIEDKNLIFKAKLTAEGQVISTQKGSFTTTQPTGEQIVEYLFPAEDIIEAEISGPYGLDIDIYEIDSFGRPILLERVLREDAILTPYKPAQFDSGDLVQAIMDTKEIVTPPLARTLKVNITLFVQAAGRYSWTCALVDNGHTTITQAQGISQLASGVNYIIAEFDGDDIRESGRTGMYFVEGFILKNGPLLLRQQKSFHTQEYSWTDFGSFATDLNGQIKGDINDVELSGDQVIIGGLFSRVAGVDARGTAIFDLKTGTWKYIDPTSAALTGTVQTVASNSKGIYAGGSLAGEDVVFADFSENAEFAPLGSVSGIIEELVANEDYLCAFGSSVLNVGGTVLGNTGVCYNFADQRWETENAFGSAFTASINAELTDNNILYYYEDGVALKSVNLTDGTSKNNQVFAKAVTLSGDSLYYATSQEFGVLDILTGDKQVIAEFNEVGGGAAISSVSAVAHDAEGDRLFFAGEIGFGATWHDDPQPVMALDLTTKNASAVTEVVYMGENTEPPTYLGYFDHYLTGFGTNVFMTPSLTSKSFFVTELTRPTTLPPTTAPPTTLAPTTTPPTTVAPTAQPTTPPPPTTKAPWVRYVEPPPEGPSVNPILWAILGVIFVGAIVVGFATINKCCKCCGWGAGAGARQRRS